jgi:hypothetical protein
MIIDLDSHLREGYFLDEVFKLKGPWAKFSPRRVGTGKYQDAQFTNVPEPMDTAPRHAREGFKHDYMYHPKDKWRGGELAERQVGGYDMERRLQDLAKEGADIQLLFPTGISLPATTAGGLGAAMCQAYNNWVSRLVKGHEDRLLPVAMAPAGCPEEMATELRRCVTELGFRAGHLVPYCGPRNVDDPVFYPYYEAAEELNVPLFCHPNSLGDLTNRFNHFFPLHVLGRPMNCTPALVALVCGGVFQRFPKLRAAFFECSAEWILYWMHRMDDDYAHMKDGVAKHLTSEPSEYVRRNCWVTCEADEKLLRVALDEFDATHVCMATDYPHFDSVFPRTVSNLRDRGDITQRQKRLILGENAQALLNL